MCLVRTWTRFWYEETTLRQSENYGLFDHASINFNEKPSVNRMLYTYAQCVCSLLILTDDSFDSVTFLCIRVTLSAQLRNVGRSLKSINAEQRTQMNRSDASLPCTTFDQVYFFHLNQNIFLRLCPSSSMYLS